MYIIFLMGDTVADLHAQVAQLTQMVEHLTTQLATHTQPTPTTSTTLTSTKQFKVASPDVFDGTLSKSESFLRQLSLYFLAKKSDFADDENKVTFALSFMKNGTAGPWADRAVERMEEGDEVFEGWDHFKELFRASFADPDPSGTARFKMDQIRQGSRSADEYVAEFREMTSKTGYNDQAHVEKFEKGLNSALIDCIYSLPEMPVMLKEWMEWAMKLDRQWRQREAHKKALGNPSTNIPRRLHPPLPVLPQQPKRSPDVVPMDVDSGKSTRPPLVCYKCRKPGHIARHCRSALDVRQMDYESIKAMMKEELQEQGF